MGLMAKDWTKRDYQQRTPSTEEAFLLEFPKAHSPWGQGQDALITQAQQGSPGLDRTFLGVRVERCTPGVCIELLSGEDVTAETVELVANTLHPTHTWVWDERSIIEHVEGGWLVTLWRKGG